MEEFINDGTSEQCLEERYSDRSDHIQAVTLCG